MSRSAGEHEFKEILVRIYPHANRATVSVHTRRRRGLDVVWQRNLGQVGVDLPDGADTTTADVMRLCAAELLRIAERSER